MKVTRISIVVLLAMVVTGCGPKRVSVKSTRLDASATLPQRGLAYSLPSRVFVVTIPYVEKKYLTYVNGILQEPTELEIECNKPITLTPMLVPDIEERFVLDIESVSDNAWYESNFSMTTTETGVLVALNSDATDKTIETLQSIFSAALSIAKTVAPAGAQVQPLSDRANALLSEIGKEADAAKRKSLQEELQLLYATIAEVVKNNHTEVVEREGTFSTVVDVKKCEWIDDRYECELLPKFPGYTSVPEVTMRVSGLPKPPASKAARNTPADSQSGSTATSANTSSNVKTAEPGIAVRRPIVGMVEVEIAQGKFELLALRTATEFPQFGATQFVNVPVKPLTSRKVALEFGAATGALTKYSIESGSSADKVAAAIKTSAAELQTAVGEIRAAQAEAEKARREAAQAQVDTLLKRLDEASGVFTKLKAMSDAASALHGVPTGG